MRFKINLKHAYMLLLLSCENQQKQLPEQFSFIQFGLCVVCVECETIS